MCDLFICFAVRFHGSDGTPSPVDEIMNFAGGNISEALVSLTYTVMLYFVNGSRFVKVKTVSFVQVMFCQLLSPALDKEGRNSNETFLGVVGLGQIKLIVLSVLVLEKYKIKLVRKGFLRHKSKANKILKSPLRVHLMHYRNSKTTTNQKQFISPLKLGLYNVLNNKRNSLIQQRIFIGYTENFSFCMMILS